MDDSLSSDDYVKLMVTLWEIWKARRDVIYEHIFQSLFATSKFIVNFIGECEADVIRTGHRIVQPPTHGVAWIPPTRDDVKGNVDGARWD